MAYRNYFEEVDEMARGIFAEYASTKEAYERAQQRRDSTPVKQYADPNYVAKAARAAADYAEADEAFKRIKRSMQRDYTDKVDAIRARLAAEIERDNMAHPSDLDTAALELMKSGILRATEYDALLDEARAKGNRTMQRLISKFAKDAATAKAEKDGTTDPEAMRLRVVANKGMDSSTDAILDGFDTMREAFNRSMNNPGMIPYWDQLTKKTWEHL